jgi:hypothetical protein
VFPFIVLFLGGVKKQAINPLVAIDHGCDMKYRFRGQPFSNVHTNYEVAQTYNQTLKPVEKINVM